MNDDRHNFPDDRQRIAVAVDISNPWSVQAIVGIDRALFEKHRKSGEQFGMSFYGAGIPLKLSFVFGETIQEVTDTMDVITGHTDTWNIQS